MSSPLFLPILKCKEGPQVTVPILQMGKPRQQNPEPGIPELWTHSAGGVGKGLTPLQAEALGDHIGCRHTHSAHLHPLPIPQVKERSKQLQRQRPGRTMADPLPGQRTKLPQEQGL